MGRACLWRRVEAVASYKARLALSCAIGLGQEIGLLSLPGIARVRDREVYQALEMRERLLGEQRGTSDSDVAEPVDSFIQVRRWKKMALTSGLRFHALKGKSGPRGVEPISEAEETYFSFSAL